MTIGPGPHIERLITESDNSPDWSIAEFRAQSDARGQIPSNGLIHKIFEAQAEQTPHLVAAVSDQRSITFKELNREASILSRYLLQRGVGPDQLVALCMDRSIELIVGILGVLKAGGAYVPLDPTNPIRRLEHLITDAAPKVTLIQERFRGLFPSSSEIVALDRDWTRIADCNDDNRSQSSAAISPESLAYVIYTSGSTGTPKGVMVTHRNVVNYASYASQRFDVPLGEGSLICTSISFDLVLTGLFPPLLSGKSIRLAPEHLSLEVLAEELPHCSNLAPLKLTPSHLSLVQHSLQPGQILGRVKTLVLGGEALQARTLEYWRKHDPRTRIFNHYGPTEATIGCIVYEVLGNESGAIPIGKPIANTRAYILDEDLRSVSAGAVGEIFIGGEGVTRGYLKRAELTAERYIADPFGTGTRVYRTGDLGKMRADGNIEYLGRGDQQVKLRGHRIELTEIEAHLLQLEKIREAVVISKEDVSGSQRLIAYLTLHGKHGSVSDLGSEFRAYLQSVLPEYMVPASFLILDALPLTPNGKVDKRALPSPDTVAQPSRNQAPPEGETEKALARLWCEILGLRQVGRNDDFFELGGHSLLGLKLLVSVSESFSIRLPPLSVFNCPTVSQMAQLIDQLSLANRLRGDALDTTSSESQEFDTGRV